MFIVSVAVNASLFLEQEDKNLTKTAETLAWKQAAHLVLGLPFSLSDVGGDDPLSLLSQSGVRIELKGNTTQLQH